MDLSENLKEAVPSMETSSSALSETYSRNSSNASSIQRSFDSSIENEINNLKERQKVARQQLELLGSTLHSEKSEINLERKFSSLKMTRISSLKENLAKKISAKKMEIEQNLKNNLPNEDNENINVENIANSEYEIINMDTSQSASGSESADTSEPDRDPDREALDITVSHDGGSSIFSRITNAEKKEFVPIVTMTRVASAATRKITRSKKKNENNTPTTCHESSATTRKIMRSKKKNETNTSTTKNESGIRFEGDDTDYSCQKKVTIFKGNFRRNNDETKSKKPKLSNKKNKGEGDKVRGGESDSDSNPGRYINRDRGKKMKVDDAVICTQSEPRCRTKSCLPPRCVLCGMLVFALLLPFILILSIKMSVLVSFISDILEAGDTTLNIDASTPARGNSNKSSEKLAVTLENEDVTLDTDVFPPSRDSSNKTSEKLPVTFENKATLSGDSEHSMRGPIMQCLNNSGLLSEIDAWMSNTDNTTTHNSMDSWCTSEVSDLAGTFSIKRHPAATHVQFNEQIGNWDVGRVTTFSKLFFGCSYFNQDLSPWDTSNVQLFTETFYFAQSFNADLSQWDTSKAQDMSRTFYRALSFNSDISGWAVDTVSSMVGMFWIATSFNADISSWNCENVIDMSYMFMMATSFTGDLSLWTVDKVTDMSRMFYGSSTFNSDISTWRVDNVNDMSGMFNGAASFNSDIEMWSTTNVIKMEEMFWGAEKFNSNISSWDVNNVNNMDSMFENAHSFNQKLCWSLNGGVSKDRMFSWSFGTIDCF